MTYQLGARNSGNLILAVLRSLGCFDGSKMKIEPNYARKKVGLSTKKKKRFSQRTSLLSKV